ncbi:hypothetical protein KO353_04425 [Elioraea tepida]|uniref:ATP-binding protein n=1 Tax=Elioraea tepida TaxID=2843330 RepID=A0A975YK84_9PROT|nr:hypothetical protein [Elioraea tepida]QXM25479.1 hypothetical protein KO353_04425 [Elioraea tepida]
MAEDRARAEMRRLHGLTDPAESIEAFPELDAEPDEPAPTIDEIVAAAADDPGAAFTPAAIEVLAALRRDDRAAFETARARLKQAGVRVTALDHAIAAAAGDEGSQRATQADILVRLGSEADLFHDSNHVCYADMEIADHRETWPLRSKGFRRWLTRRYFEETDGAPNSEAVQSALGVLEAKAHFAGEARAVHLRVAGDDRRIWIDLGSPDWRVVEVTPAGWHIIPYSECPVRFRRAAGMLALPDPQRGGSIDELRRFLNVASDEDFVLVVSCLLAAFRPRGPYPVLALAGEHGSAKSSAARALRSLVDPNATPLRAPPREDRDLFIAATNAHVVAFDNVSGLQSWLSDTLCRLATGGGFATRQLYSDADEALFDACRPIILTGIEDYIGRADLADRSVFITLEPIQEAARRPEAELDAALNAARPRILGALLDAVAHGLAHLPDVGLSRLPRMADFAIWATACETALWPAGTFMAAYDRNRAAATETTIEGDAVAAAVRSLVDERGNWKGTAAELLEALAPIAGERVVAAKTWPATPRAMAGRLRRAAPLLRSAGIDVGFERAANLSRARTISLQRLEKAGALPSKPSNRPARLKNIRDINSIPAGRSMDGVAANATPTVQSPAPTVQRDRRLDGSSPDDQATVHSTVHQTNHTNPLNGNGFGAGLGRLDGLDGSAPTLSSARAEGAPAWRAKL